MRWILKVIFPITRPRFARLDRNRWFVVGPAINRLSPSMIRGAANASGGRIPSDQVRCAAHCLLFRTEAAVAAQPPAAGDGSTTGTWRWLEADQWEARHTRANHNAYCCRRAVRPHPWIASSTSARRQLLQLGQVEISAGAPFAPLLRFALILFLENISRSEKFIFRLYLRIMRT